jgi:ubiquinone biosynthesis accessory factor UbiJ
VTATPAWLASIEAVLNRNLEDSVESADAAKRLEGRTLRLDISTLISVRAGIHGGRLMLSCAEEQEAADAVIAGSPFALLNLMTAAAANPGSATTVQVRGDAEVANRFRDLFKLLRPDIEAEVSRFIGDVPAHGLAKFASAALGWSRKAVASSRANIAEYLQEESRDLVNKTELTEFLRGVDQVREAADRAEARLALLERKRQQAS